MTNDQFRAMFPEFISVERFPDATVNVWLSVATASLPADRWGAWLEMGLGLFTAHQLALTGREAAAIAPGSAAVGPLASKSVGGVSASYDTAAGTVAGGGHWNLTSYGIRFMAFAELVGAGGIQL